MGPDLRGVFLGSEGTLGVITEVTVRLRPMRTTPPRTVVGFFDTLAAAGDAVTSLAVLGVEVLSVGRGGRVGVVGFLTAQPLRRHRGGAGVERAASTHVALP